MPDCSKNILNFRMKIEACPIDVGLYMASKIAFHLRPFWLKTLFAIDSESCQRSFPSFCAPPCEVAVLLNKNVVDLDLQLCTGPEQEHADLFLGLILIQRWYETNVS